MISGANALCHKGKPMSLMRNVNTVTWFRLPLGATRSFAIPLSTLPEQQAMTTMLDGEDTAIGQAKVKQMC